VTNISSRRS